MADGSRTDVIDVPAGTTQPPLSAKYLRPSMLQPKVKQAGPDTPGHHLGHPQQAHAVPTCVKFVERALVRMSIAANGSANGCVHVHTVTSTRKETPPLDLKMS